MVLCLKARESRSLPGLQSATSIETHIAKPQTSGHEQGRTSGLFVLQKYNAIISRQRPRKIRERTVTNGAFAKGKKPDRIGPEVDALERYSCFGIALA